MKKVIVLLAAVLLASSVAVAGQSKKEGKDMSGKPKAESANFEKRMEEFRSQLGLTPEQDKAVNDLNVSLKEKRQSARANIANLRKEQSEAMAKNDYETARAKANEISAIESQMKISVINYKESLGKILTAEQNAKFNSMMETAKKEKKEKTKGGAKSAKKPKAEKRSKK